MRRQNGDYAVRVEPGAVRLSTELHHLTIGALRDALVYIEHVTARHQITQQEAAEDQQATDALLRRVSPGAYQPHWKVIARHRLKQRLAKGGDRVATILLHLMERPGVSVAQQELMHLIGGKSQSSNIIKVYICYLRQGLKSFGLSEDVIETTRGGYALRKDAFELLLHFLDE